MKKSLLVGMLLILSSVLVAAPVWAECQQQELEGTWTVEMWGGVNSLMCWDQLTLTIDQNGVIEAGSTFVDCRDENQQVVGGQLNISSGCVIDGWIETSSGILGVENGAFLEDTILLGRSAE